MKRGRGSREIATPQTEQAEPLLAWCGSTDPAWRTLLEAIPESLAPNIELLRCNDVSDWIAQCEPAKNIQLLVGLEHRNDHHALELLKQLAAPPTPKTTPQTASNAHRKKSSTTSRSKPKPNQSLAIAAVLGEDWQGHRRTFPLPDSLETFYWYQWFDGVLPWIQSRDLLPANNQQLSPRVGRIIDRSEQAKSILRAHMQQPSMQQPCMQLAACRNRVHAGFSPMSPKALHSGKAFSNNTAFAPSDHSSMMLGLHCKQIASFTPPNLGQLKPRCL